MNDPIMVPLKELQEELRRVTKPDAVILDPFMGSGTTLKAAKQHGKKCIGVEITRSICETAVERLREDVEPVELYSSNK